VKGNSGYGGFLGRFFLAGSTTHQMDKFLDSRYTDLQWHHATCQIEASRSFSVRAAMYARMSRSQTAFDRMQSACTPEYTAFFVNLKILQSTSHINVSIKPRCHRSFGNPTITPTTQNQDMWLINCRNLTLEEIVDSSRAPPYAILSHTWVKDQEVHQSEFLTNSFPKKTGWEKIWKTCELALKDGCQYAWVDTCCIDKSSSAELTEAINSMFAWYKGAEICYAFLMDYDLGEPVSPTKSNSTQLIAEVDVAAVLEAGLEINTFEGIAKAKWFSRGWTLQELIAPRKVRFYDMKWRDIGTKDSLSHMLSLITGIQQEILCDSGAEDESLEERLSEVPIAKRMSWASRRETTRVEDIAYCLLGIFGINLPLLYGEGERAFIRLQEEIVRNSNDLSILAWRAIRFGEFTEVRHCGVLASHPVEFRGSGQIISKSDSRFTPEFVMTNKGLRFQMRLGYDKNKRLHFLDTYAGPGWTLAIYLKHQGASCFARAKPCSMYVRNNDKWDEFVNTTFYLSKSITPRVSSALNEVHRNSFGFRYDKKANWELLAAQPEVLWDSRQAIYITAGLQAFVGYHEYEYRGDLGLQNGNGAQGSVVKVFIVFGYEYDCEPWIRLFSLSGNGLFHEGSRVGQESVEKSIRFIQLQIKRGDWQQVAYHATLVPNGKIKLGNGCWFLSAELVRDTYHDGEPVYVCQLKVTEESFSVRSEKKKFRLVPYVW
jgi:hypothetical protein